MSFEVITIISVVVAAIIGFLFGRYTGKSSAALEEENAKEDLLEYKRQVSEHFGKTADLVDQLTDKYKDVFDHLNQSAHTLLDKEEIKKHLDNRDQVVTLAYLDKADANNTQATPKPVQEHMPSHVDATTESHENAAEQDDAAADDRKASKATNNASTAKAETDSENDHKNT